MHAIYPQKYAKSKSTKQLINDLAIMTILIIVLSIHPIGLLRKSTHISVIKSGAFFIAKNVMTNNENPKLRYPNITISVLVQVKSDT